MKFNHRGLHFVVPLVLSVLCVCEGTTPPSVKFGFLYPFDKGWGKSAASAVHYAVSLINGNSAILPDTKIEVVEGDTQSDFEIGTSASLKLVESSCYAVAGPGYSYVAAMALVSGGLSQTPLLGWGTTDPSLTATFPWYTRVINSNAMVSEAFTAIAKEFKWPQVAVLNVADTFGRNSMRPFLTELQAMGVIVFNIELQMGADNYTAEVAAARATESTIFFVVTYAPEYATFMRDAVAQNLLVAGTALLGTNGLWEAVQERIPADLRPSMQGLIVCQTIFPDNPEKARLTAAWKELDPAQYPNTGPGTTPNIYDMAAYDTVLVFADALHNLLTHNLSLASPPPPFVASQGRRRDWPFGVALRAQIRQSLVSGTTGVVNFDAHGERAALAMRINNYDGAEWVAAGAWASVAGLPKQLTFAEQGILWPGNTRDIPTGKPRLPDRLKLWTKLKPAMLEETSDGKRQGLLEDLRWRLQEDLNVQIELVVFPGTYSEMVDNITRPSGVIGIMADLTVTAKRGQLVKFIQPFFVDGLRVLVAKVAAGGVTTLMQFLDPFHWSLWLCLLAMALFSAKVLNCLEWAQVSDTGQTEVPFFAASGSIKGRVREWGRKYRRELPNSIWWAFGAYVGASDSWAFATMPARMFVGVWLFAVVIVTSSYTANLASFLLASRFSVNLKGIEDIVQRGLSIAINCGGNNEAVLRDRYSARNIRCVDGEANGLPVLKDGNVAGVVGANYVLTLLSQGDCDSFSLVGDVFADESFAIALNMNTETVIVETLESIIVRYWNEGFLERLRAKWIDKDGACDSADSTEATQLMPSHLVGLFLLVIVTAVVAIALRVFFSWYEARNPPKAPPPPKLNKAERRRRLAQRRGLGSLGSTGSISDSDELTSGHMLNSSRAPPLVQPQPHGNGDGWESATPMLGTPEPRANGDRGPGLPQSPRDNVAGVRSPVGAGMAFANGRSVGPAPSNWEDLSVC